MHHVMHHLLFYLYSYQKVKRHSMLFSRFAYSFAQAEYKFHINMTVPIQMFLYIYLMHFKEILKKLIGNNVDPSFPQQIMFLIHVQ